MKKTESKPLLETYNRLFGKMDSFDRLGIKKGKLNEVSDKSRIIRAIRSANDDSYGGVFDDELKERMQAYLNLYKVADSKDKRIVVDLLEKWAVFQHSIKGRRVPVDHPIQMELVALFDKYNFLEN